MLHGDFQHTQKYNQEVPSEEPEWTPALKQEDPEPSGDVEQEEIGSSQQRENLMEVEENSVSEFSSVPALVKREFDVEEPQSAQLHDRQSGTIIKVEPAVSSSTPQMEPESDSEDCGGAEPLNSVASDKTSDSSDTETEDSDDDWKRAASMQSHVKAATDEKAVKSQPVQRSSPAPVNEDKTSDSSDGDTEDSDTDLGKSSESQSGSSSSKHKEVPAGSHSTQHQKQHTMTQTAQMAFHGSHFIHKKKFDKERVRTDSAERRSSGSASKKSKSSASLNEIFICSRCGKSFHNQAHLVLHMKIHKAKSKLSSTDGR